MTKTTVESVTVCGNVIMKKRLGGHKSPMERLFDIIYQVAVANGKKTFAEVDIIKSQEYRIRDSRELIHATSIRKMGSDSFKDESSFKQWGRKLVPEGLENITGAELIDRIVDAAVDNPINFKSNYRKPDPVSEQEDVLEDET